MHLNSQALASNPSIDVQTFTDYATREKPEEKTYINGFSQEAHDKIINSSIISQIAFRANQMSYRIRNRCKVVKFSASELT